MKPLAIFATTALLSLRSFSQEMTAPVVGQQAPDFALQYATKDSIFRTPLKLSEAVGKQNIILAFYPADWSTGCTKEVCAMRDDFGNLEKLNAGVLGISGDYVWSHYEWAKHHNLPFKLLSDHNHEIAKKYSSYNEKTQYNKRTVFVVDKNGAIAYVDLEYSVRDSEDFTRLKEALSKLQ
ncbi:MAG: peroxiredoxin [Ignavibacteriales bacterium]|nr:peroxiredoxin [Ignavibacteriales bacterium]